MQSAGLENRAVWLGVEGNAPGFSSSRGSCFSFLTDLHGKPGAVKRDVLPQGLDSHGWLLTYSSTRLRGSSMGRSGS